MGDSIWNIIGGGVTTGSFKKIWNIWQIEKEVRFRAKSELCGVLFY